MLMRQQSIAIEPMTAGAFAPFGWLIEPGARPHDRRVLSPVDFECDGRTTVSTIWQPAAGGSFSRLERHFGVTQTFFQLAGSPAVVCVAEATDLDDPSAVPDPSSVRAFGIDAERGFSFARGTWHSLDRYVLSGAGASFVIVNVDPNPTQIVDYASGLSETYRDLDDESSSVRETLTGPFGVRFEVVA